MMRAKAKSNGTGVDNLTMVAGLLAVLVMSAGLVLMASPTHATTTFTVNSTGDSSDRVFNDGLCDTSSLAGNQCTLRAAIQEANLSPGADTINFGIPGDFVRTIFPTSQLPEIIETVTIDGYTQSGTSPNTLASGTNAVLKIQLDGSSAGSTADGLRIAADDVVVRGLAINRFGGNGVQIEGNRNNVAGNFIGTSAGGTLDLGNGAGGVLLLDGGSNTIGGGSPSQRNLISGNGLDGVSLNEGSRDNSVQGNVIGTNKDGKGDLGNGSNGVLVAGSQLNAIGDSNTIAFNDGDGVSIASSSVSEATENVVFGNSIFSNAGLGIDLRGGTESASGATNNDPLDADAGPNGLQNKPVVNSATTSSGRTTVKGKLNSTPNGTFELHFYSNPSGNEGKSFLGQKEMTTDASGNAAFTFAPSRAVAAGQTVTATATHDPETGGDSTSEFSAPRTVVAQ